MRARAHSDRPPSDQQQADQQRSDQQRAAGDGVYAQWFLDLGDIYARTQRHAEALDAYLWALRLAPRDLDVHLALGQTLIGQRQFRSAIGVLERALRLDLERASAHSDLGDALSGLALGLHAPDHAPDEVEALSVQAQPAAQGEPVARAVACYERALQLDPCAANAYRGLARVRLGAGEWTASEALACVDRGLASVAASGPSARVDLYIDKADLLLRRADSGDVEAAIHALRAALNIRPRDVRACRLLGDALERAERSERSERSEDDTVGAWFGLGGALEGENNWRDAASAYERAIERKPDCLRAWLKLGDAHLALGDPNAAIRCFEAAVAIDPAHPAAHVNLGWALRMAGDFVRGWRESAWNYRASDKRRFEQPMWDGAPLGARRLLLWADFALGDTVQDLRYLTLVRARHPQARIVLECDRRLVSLIEEGLTSGTSPSPPDLERVVAHKAPLPAFDTHLPLRRLPELLGIELTSIPRDVPYLAADPLRISQWRQRLDHSSSAAAKAHRGRDRGVKLPASKSIGIVWAGDQTRTDARTKSASLADFEPLADLAQTAALRIISLQLGPNVDELIAPPPRLRVERLLDGDRDVADTAALMSSLDLIITVDTMTAHLAGALGKPVWVLASYSPAWWLWHIDSDTARDIDRSRWYPTMRVFRQERMGDWEGVMRRVCEALRTDLST